MSLAPTDRWSQRLPRRALALALGAAFATPPATAAPVDEVIVTARKSAETLSTVPLQIDVVAGEGPEPTPGALQNLIARVPGLYFESLWGGTASAPTLRGQQTSPTGDVNVGVFVDGIYQANPTAIDAAPLDVQRIEIVRGPQSALYGHSTFAGAIHYVSHAPSAEAESGVALGAGSAGSADIAGHIAGPIFGGGLLGRLAVGASTFDGTLPNPSGSALGGRRRSSLALQIATADDAVFDARVAARFSRTSSAQPAVTSLHYRDYNCGSRDPSSGAWSYYCGALPITDRFDLSSDVPDSDSEIRQLAATLSWRLRGARLTSTTSFYRGDTTAYRDFDASSIGEQFGVCTLGPGCGGVSQLIDRYAFVNEIWREQKSVTEWNEELRLAKAESGRLHWDAGIAFWRTESRSEAAFGAARGTLTPLERLTVLQPANPLAVGPQSRMNLALVADPARAQVTQALDLEERHTLAAFGAVDVALTKPLRLRLEARTTRELRALDNRVANFQPGFGSSIPALVFRDVTPRISLQYLSDSPWSGYVSAAKGSQSGGVNPIPGLSPPEQGYQPEFNWTYEATARFAPPRRNFGFTATLYSIDWRDTQLIGASPTVASLITLNTAGIRTRGIEVSVHAQPLAVVRTEAQLSYTDPKFRAGSDDPGDARFCGITPSNRTSSFCVVGVSRTGASQIVAYIDDNVPGRVPRQMWHAAIEVAPPVQRGTLALRFDANGQNDVFDRPIEGARYGARTLFDMRVSYAFGPWNVAFWGRNLGDERYIRALSSRGQVFFPTTPRPLDAIYGDGRRLGISATFTRAHGP